MSITASQVKEIRQEFAKLKPTAVTLDGNRAMTVEQAIFTLAPTLERMKKRGFDTQEIVEKLHEKGRKTQKRDTPPAASATRTTPQLHYS